MENLVVVDISPVNASPGAEAMKNFLTVMEEVRFDSIMQRATARRIVDEQLQTVVQVLRDSVLLTLYLNPSLLLGQYAKAIPPDQFSGR